MSLSNCYLLCIGVDTYDSASIPNLSGCVRDAQHFLEYIQQHVNTDCYQLHSKSLFSGGTTPPTRQNIIAAIREHLGQAQTGDLAVLFYAGHGSKEKAPPSFGEEDGYAQTLVPADARTDNAEGRRIRNILDKEFRLLLHELWATDKPDIVIIQDTCHSTGATRQAERVRMVEESFVAVKQAMQCEVQEITLPPTPVPRYVDPDAQERGYQHWKNSSLEELLHTYTAFDRAPEALQSLLDHLDESVSVASAKALPLADHIHMAACGKQEFAYELPGKGGVFTSNLLTILAAAQNSISYHDLFSRIRMNIDGAYAQTPDLYVRGTHFQKRYEPFLGQLLRQGERPPERDRDVFSGFYPLAPRGRRGWKIRAGELELLSVVQDQNVHIPIEVFLQSESPKGLSNAVITTVTPEYSTVEFTTAQFDPHQHRNQLYGMIAARYLRRWRVPVFVDSQAAQGSLVELFEDYGPRLQLKNFQHDGGPAIRRAEKSALAHYQIRVVGEWLQLLDNQNTILLQSSAAQQTTAAGLTRASAVRQGAEGGVQQYRRGGYMPWVETNPWSFSPYLKDALAPLFDYLQQQYEQRPEHTLLVFLQEATAAINPFTAFLQTYAQQLAYFKPFINWTSPDKASHVIRINEDSFAIHHYKEGKISEIPVCHNTQGRSPQAGFEVILNLQKICKWQTVRNLYNRAQAVLLPHHQFELIVKAYTDFKAGDQRSFEQALFQSNNDQHYQQADRGLSKPLHELGASGPFRFVQHPERPSTVVLQLDLAFRHLEGIRPVFVSTLLLDPTYAVLPLQRALGSNLLPPAEGHSDAKGTLHILQVELPRPTAMRHYPEDVEEVTYYIKILMAYERFDVSGLLQDGLPPPAPPFDFFQQEPSSGHRAVLTKVPEKSAPGSWLAFTLPLVVQRPH